MNEDGGGKDGKDDGALFGYTPLFGMQRCRHDGMIKCGLWEAFFFFFFRGVIEGACFVGIGYLSGDSCVYLISECNMNKYLFTLVGCILALLKEIRWILTLSCK
jgi:hypothetical protein